MSVLCEMQKARNSGLSVHIVIYMIDADMTFVTACAFCHKFLLTLKTFTYTILEKHICIDCKYAFVYKEIILWRR